MSTGGRAIDITDRIDPSFAHAAIRAVHDIGLAFAGVDVIADDLCVPGRYGILEVNAEPGLDQFAISSPQGMKRTRAIYRTLVRMLAQC